MTAHITIKRGGRVVFDQDVDPNDHSDPDRAAAHAARRVARAARVSDRDVIAALVRRVNNNENPGDASLLANYLTQRD